jgi:uncharacterized protein (DUF1501 family)
MNERTTDLSRRALLGGSSALAAATALGGTARAARAGGTRPVVVQVFLRGAMDGLTTVVPYADGELYAARPTLAIAPPGPGDGARDLDGFFGLAPAAAPLLTPWSDGRLAIVHAAGSIDPTRSHFDAFVRMEYGDPALPPGTVSNGWLARYLEATRALATSPLRAVGAGDLMPRALDGALGALPIPDLATFSFPGRPATAARRAAVLVDTHARTPPPVGPAGLGTLASIGILAGIDFAGYAPANGAEYPATPFGARLRSVAALVKAQVGVEVVTLDLDGWDLHAELGPVAGAMALLLDELARGLEAFYLDLLGHLDDYVLVCLSEFGRRVAENSSAGTDHGHGNALFVMGGGVAGGQVLAAWPGLTPDVLDSGDLAVTIDYRDVLGEILALRCGLGATELGALFPQHAFAFSGVIA